MALKTLEDTPDNPLANLTAGRWLWFQKGEVGRGLSDLAKGGDLSLRQLAQRELTEQPTESDAQLKRADASWESVQTRKGEENDYFMLHAADWYKEATPTLPGSLTKVRNEKQLEEVAVLKRSLAKSLIALPAGVRLKSGIRCRATAGLICYLWWMWSDIARGGCLAFGNANAGSRTLPIR